MATKTIWQRIADLFADTRSRYDLLELELQDDTSAMLDTIAEFRARDWLDDDNSPEALARRTKAAREQLDAMRDWWAAHGMDLRDELINAMQVPPGTKVRLRHLIAAADKNSILKPGSTRAFQATAEVKQLSPDELARRTVRDEPSGSELDQALEEAHIELPADVLERVRTTVRVLTAIDATTVSSQEGNEAHAVICFDYLLTHSLHDILFDRFLTSTSLYSVAGFPMFKSMPASSLPPQLARAQAALRTPAGDLFRPDILDFKLREVWEIKPIAGAVNGLKQLVTNALLPLNRAEVGQELAVALAKGMRLEGGLPDVVLPAGAKPYLPGGWRAQFPDHDPRWVSSGWRPARFYAIPPDSLIMTWVPVPGLILYQKFKSKLSLTEEEYEHLADVYRAQQAQQLAQPAAAHRQLVFGPQDMGGVPAKVQQWETAPVPEFAPLPP